MPSVRRAASWRRGPFSAEPAPASAAGPSAPTTYAPPSPATLALDEGTGVVDCLEPELSGAGDVLARFGARLEPDAFDARRGGVLGDSQADLRRHDHVDDAGPLRQRRQRGVAGVAVDLPGARVDRVDPVAAGLERLVDAVA